MKKLTTRVMIATAALVVAASAASAQTRTAMTAQIPFEFRAGNQVMAPGTYQVESLSTQSGAPIFRLLEVQSHRSRVIVPQAKADPQQGWKARETRSWCSRASAVVARSLSSGPG